MTTFYEKGLSAPIVKAADNMGFEEATPIQGRTITLLMDGRDVIGQAQTGTGRIVALGKRLREKEERIPKGLNPDSKGRGRCGGIYD